MMIKSWTSPLDVIRENFGATQVNIRDIVEKDLVSGKVRHLYSVNIYGPDTEVVRHFETAEERHEWILKAGVQGDSASPLSTVGRLFPFSLSMNKAQGQEVLAFVKRARTVSGERGRLLGFTEDRYGEPCLVLETENNQERQIQFVTLVGVAEWYSRPEGEWTKLSQWMKANPYCDEVFS